jgi:hypothetical protein
LIQKVNICINTHKNISLHILHGIIIICIFLDIFVILFAILHFILVLLFCCFFHKKSHSITKPHSLPFQFIFFHPKNYFLTHNPNFVFATSFNSSFYPFSFPLAHLHFFLHHKQKSSKKWHHIITSLESSILLHLTTKKF